MVLHAYARLVQDQAAEEYRFALLCYAIQSPYLEKSAKAPPRPSVLDWDL